MSVNLFELAVRNKYRFTSPPGVNPQGQLTTENLLDLSVDALDALAVALDDQLEKKTKSFKSNKRSAAQAEIQNKLELVKAILLEKEELACALKEAKALLAEEKELDILVAAKQSEAKAALSVEELEKMRNDIRAKRLALTA